MGKCRTMYVCMHVCMYVRMYVCMYEPLYTYILYLWHISVTDQEEVCLPPEVILTLVSFHIFQQHSILVAIQGLRRGVGAGVA